MSVWKRNFPWRWAYSTSSPIPATLCRTLPTATTTATATTRRSWSRRYYLTIRSNFFLSALHYFPPLQVTSRSCLPVNTATRCLTSSSSPDSRKPDHPIDSAVQQYLIENLSNFQIPAEQQSTFHQRLVQTLEPVYGKRITVSHLQSFGAAGLQALAKSIQQELFSEQQQGGSSSNYVTVRFQAPHHRTEFDLKWYNYQTEPLLSVAERTAEGAQLLSEYLERACRGNAMCSTCHVYVQNNDDDDALLSRKSTAEKDMLDLAYQPNPTTSRLACQVLLEHVPPEKVNSDEPALTVILPSGVNNLY